MKKTLALVLALVMLCSASLASAATFWDMEASQWAWACETVEELAALGIVGGYADGTYRPENSVTNEEAFVAFARALGVNSAENVQAVKDAQAMYSAVAANYPDSVGKELCFLLYRGVLEESDLKDYLAEDVKTLPIQRHEAAKLITRILGGEKEAAQMTVPTVDYTDKVTFPAGSAGYIDYATKYGVMTGMGDGTFSANSGVTRAQIAIMLKRMMMRLNMRHNTGTITSLTETAFTLEEGYFEVTDAAIIHKNGKLATMLDLEVGDTVVVSTAFWGVYAIDAESKYMELDGAILKTLGYVDNVNKLTIAHADAAYDATVWTLTNEVVVTRNGNPATLTDLLAGDVLKLGFTYGEITSIAARSSNSSVEGSITAIHLERERPYIVLRVSETDIRTIYLTMDSKVSIDNMPGDVYDLVLGYIATVNTESETASEIKVSSAKQSTTLTGTVTLVNEAFGFVRGEVRDALTGEVYANQIFVNDETVVFINSTGEKISLANVAVGDLIVATGAERLGAFEASTIVVINK